MFTEKLKNQHKADGIGIIEAVKQDKVVESGALVARSIVDREQLRSIKVPMRIFNPTLNTITVNRGSCIAKITPAVSCEKIKAQNPDEGPDEIIKNVPPPLKNLYNASITELSPEDHWKVAALLNEYQDVFSSGDHDLGRTAIIKHISKTESKAAIRQRPRGMAPALQAEAYRQIEDMLDRGVIEPSTSPWSSPIVLVTKKDGTKRFCMDYRKLNSVTVKDSYPIPRIDETLDSLT